MTKSNQITHISIVICLMLLILLVCWSCKERTEKIILKNEAPEKFGLLKYSDSVATSMDSTITKFNYNSIVIDVEKHPSYNGDIVTVTTPSTTFEIGVEYGCFFKGLVNDLVIIDTGTGQSRGLEIYSATGELVLDTEYINELQIEGQLLIFWSSIDPETVEILPDCFTNNENTQFSIGLISKNLFIFRTRSLQYSNDIDCQFYE